MTDATETKTALMPEEQAAAPVAQDNAPVQIPKVELDAKGREIIGRIPGLNEEELAEWQAIVKQEIGDNLAIAEARNVLQEVLNTFAKHVADLMIAKGGVTQKCRARLGEKFPTTGAWDIDNMTGDLIEIVMPKMQAPQRPGFRQVPASANGKAR